MEKKRERKFEFSPIGICRNSGKGTAWTEGIEPRNNDRHRRNGGKRTTSKKGRSWWVTVHQASGSVLPVLVEREK